jgi:flagellar hook assembly protein FlgD
LGQKIRTLVDENKKAGYHQARWDGRNYNGLKVSSGIYIYRFQVGDFKSSRKMLFMM